MKTKTRNSLLAVCLSAVLVATATVAAGPALEVGEVSAPHVKLDFARRQFRNTVNESVARLDTARVKGGPYVVSASIVRLSAASGEHGVQSTAVVETVLRHKSSGHLIAMTQGKATAAAPGGSLADAQNSALRAALESALKDVPQVLLGR
jgi:hypothetical protein